MKKFLIALLLILCCGSVGCKKSVEFELRKGTCGFDKKDREPCLILISDDFWVDRGDLIDIIEANGGCIKGCDWTGVFWTVEEDMDEHIKKITPKIREWGEKNRR